MKNRELHVPRYRGQATEPMGLYVAEEDHDRVVALLKVDSNAWEETAKTFEDFYRKTESECDALQSELTKALGEVQRYKTMSDNYCALVMDANSELTKARELMLPAAHRLSDIGQSRLSEPMFEFVLAHQSAPAAKSGV